MKKRLRKKKHIGEFKIWGVPITIKRAMKTNFDSFLDKFIEEAIEASDCYFGGGGGKEDHLEGFIELGHSSEQPESRLNKISKWLDERTDIEKYVTGELIDVWYGPFDELDLIGDKI